MTESQDLLTELAGWVRMETPSTDAAAVNRLMDVAQNQLAHAAAYARAPPTPTHSARIAGCGVLAW